MYRNFYSYNDMPQIARPEKIPKSPAPSVPVQKKEEMPIPSKNNRNLLNKLESDDLILIIVALLLLANGCDDTLLLAALGFIFISGIL